LLMLIKFKLIMVAPSGMTDSIKEELLYCDIQ
jgi:hypothetical protein